jgi:hypothetical protein
MRISIAIGYGKIAPIALCLNRSDTHDRLSANRLELGRSDIIRQNFKHRLDRHID